MTDDSGREIARQDEVLELMYWLEGEGFARDATLDGLRRLLARDAQTIAETVARLVDRGYLVSTDGQFRLTPTGRVEAARRFADEFSSLLGGAQGECNDPTCECHTSPAGAAECHAMRASGGHQH